MGVGDEDSAAGEEVGRAGESEAGPEEGVLDEEEEVRADCVPEGRGNVRISSKAVGKGVDGAERWSRVPGFAPENALPHEGRPSRAPVLARNEKAEDDRVPREENGDGKEEECEEL